MILWLIAGENSYTFAFTFYYQFSWKLIENHINWETFD